MGLDLSPVEPDGGMGAQVGGHKRGSFPGSCSGQPGCETSRVLGEHMNTTQNSPGPRFTSRQIATLGGLVSGAWSVFWFIQTVLGGAAASLQPLLMSFYFGLMAVSFANGFRTKTPSRAWWVLSIAAAALLVKEYGSRGAMRTTAIATLATAIGLVAVGMVLERRRRHTEHDR
jgi:hypothetical protein